MIFYNAKNISFLVRKIFQLFNPHLNDGVNVDENETFFETESWYCMGKG